MNPVTSVSIDGHTTASSPRPHILYNLRVGLLDGKQQEVSRRYSDFVNLHKALGDEFSLPPKRLLATTFIPSAWVDDTLISERKDGLSSYLSDLLNAPQYKKSPKFAQFLSPNLSSGRTFDVEDALPSTLSRKTALSLQNQIEAKAVTPIACSYYEDWATSPTPANIDYSKYDIIFFAFATPSSSYGLSWDSGATTTLKSLVSAAHGSSKQTKVVLSVGGWGGCEYYSAAMSSSANRTTFINALASAVSTYNLDGIDIDWEYPNSSGAGQPYSSKDSTNLLYFFEALRTKLGTSKIISAAVTQLPWLGSNGNPLTDVSAYAKQMNYVNIMNYDVNSSSSTPGPNAPLSDACGTSSQPQATAEAAFAQWTAAGFPAGQLLLGLPTYGYVSQSSKTKLTGSFQLQDGQKTEANPVATKPHPRSRRNPDTEAKNKAAASGGDLSSWYGQQIPFNAIVSGGALKKSGSVYVSANGYTYAWDDCSDTPFLYDTSRKTVVTFDDTYSLADKAAYAKSQGMAGCFTWALDEDDGTTLQTVIRSSLGI